MVQQPDRGHFLLLLLALVLTCPVAGCAGVHGAARGSGGQNLTILWQYEFSAAAERVAAQQERLTRLAASTGSAVEVRQKKSAADSLVAVRISGQGSLADLQRLLFNPDDLIPKLTGQPTEVRIKGVMPAGREITLAIASNLTTGYRWQIAAPPALSVREAPSAGVARQGPLLGRAGRQEFMAHAATGGETVIILNYRRSWQQRNEQAVLLSLTLPGEWPATLDLSEP